MIGPEAKSLSMNSLMGKRLLSLIRRFDFAHPGEEEAIRMAFENVPRDDNRLILDVGCGLGGTAFCLQEWGLS